MSLRERFLLRPDIIFLNHGSFGACPRPVFETYQAWQLELERQPVEFLSTYRRFPALMREARVALGQYLGADPDDLVYVPNATTGVNIVARSLSLQPGDQVLTTDHEYGACDRTWQFICAKRGAEYIRQLVPIPIESAEQVIEAVWSGVTPRTRVLFISHLTSLTAIIFPIGELIRRARERGIITVVDGAHAPGQLPLALDDLGADFYCGNPHKWALCPKGSGFLYARREVQSLLEPLIVSWGWESEPDYPRQTPFIDSLEFQGTRDISAYLATPAAIHFMAEHDWPNVRAHCHELVRVARAGITALTGLPPLTPDDPAWYAQMAAFLLPPCDIRALKSRLYDQYKIEIPLTMWNQYPLIRISIQGYNTLAEVETLLEALKVLLPQVTGEG